MTIQGQTTLNSKYTFQKVGILMLSPVDNHSHIDSISTK